VIFEGPAEPDRENRERSGLHDGKSPSEFQGSVFHPFSPLGSHRKRAVAAEVDGFPVIAEIRGVSEGFSGRTEVVNA